MKSHFLGILTPFLVVLALTAPFAGAQVPAGTPYGSTADFAKYAMKLRESVILRMEPQVIVSTASHSLGTTGRYPWKTGIVTTVFWIGEPAGGNNPVHNISSSWDLNWMQSYGGYDNPDP